MSDIHQNQPYLRRGQNNLDAEKAVLGSLLLSSEAFNDVKPIVQGRMFQSYAHELIFLAIEYVLNTGVQADPVTVGDYLFSTGELKKVPGGASYLHELVSFVPTAASAAWYAEIVRDNYQRRTLHNAAVTVQQKLSDGSKIQDALTAFMEASEELTAAVVENKPILLGESFDETVSILEHGNGGYPTGINDFDDTFGGLAKATLTLIGARPGMGKTVCGMTFARGFMSQGLPVLFFSLEMTRPQVLIRQISALCRINSRKLEPMRPSLTESDWQKIADKAPRLLNDPLYVFDDTLTVERICQIARQFKKQHPDFVVIIDFLQILSSEKKDDPRHQEIGDISRNLKLLANELQIPVIALSQLNREVENRADKTPTLADLRDSGALEQNADNVFFLYRDDVYDKESPRAGEVDVIGAKIRASVTGKVTLAALMHYSTFADMAAH